MFSRARYIHHQIPDGTKYRGFSVLLEPAIDGGSVHVTVTFCSKSDQFCKHTARQTLDNKASFYVPVANLPKVLYAYQVKCGAVWDEVESQYSKHSSNQWTWVWKYFL